MIAKRLIKILKIVPTLKRILYTYGVLIIIFKKNNYQNDTLWRLNIGIGGFVLVFLGASFMIFANWCAFLTNVYTHYGGCQRYCL